MSITYYATDLSDLKQTKILCTGIIFKAIQIDYLVNNTGFGLSGEFASIPWERLALMVSLNMITLTYLTHEIGNLMKKRGQGYILNVASTTAVLPLPNLALYSASKAFVLNFSEAIYNEFKPYG